MSASTATRKSNWGVAFVLLFFLSRREVCRDGVGRRRKNKSGPKHCRKLAGTAMEPTTLPNLTTCCQGDLSKASKRCARGLLECVTDGNEMFGMARLLNRWGVAAPQVCSLREMGGGRRGEVEAFLWNDPLAQLSKLSKARVLRPCDTVSCLPERASWLMSGRWDDQTMITATKQKSHCNRIVTLPSCRTPIGRHHHHRISIGIHEHKIGKITIHDQLHSALILPHCAGPVPEDRFGTKSAVTSMSTPRSRHPRSMGLRLCWGRKL
jgi:hypothetical protein